MRNRFAASCKKCGRLVLAGQGETNKGDNGKWVTVHDNCPVPSAPVPTRSNRHYRDNDEGYRSSYDEEFDREFYAGMTSEDFNPNEGDK